MERLDRLRQRIGSMAELMEVVGAMRLLAVARMQQATDALAGAREYSSSIGESLARALTLLPENQWPSEGGGGRRAAPRGLLVFGAEHGFVGGYNEALADAVDTARTGNGPLFVVGSRLVLTVKERGLQPEWTTPMTVHRDGVPATARRIAEALERHLERGALGGLDMVFARAEAAGQWRIVGQSLLPVDLRLFHGAATASPPLANLDPMTLIARLVAEYLYAELAGTAMEALASENAARYAAMAAARENVETRLADLRAEENRLRQAEITDELMEVVTGAEAIVGTGQV